MRHLSDQLDQVAVTYVTRAASWGWRLAMSLPMFVFLYAHSSQAGMLYLVFMVSLLLASFVRDQSLHHFAHPRAAMLPGFVLPHLLIAGGIAAFATLFLPTLLGPLTGTSPLLLAAVGSVAFAVTQLMASRLFSWLIIAAILIPSFFGYSIFDLDIESYLLSTNYLVLIGSAWTLILCWLIQLAWLREDDATYHTDDRSTAGSRIEARDWYNRVTNLSNLRQYTRRWIVSDWWNDRIGSYHQNDRRQIIRALRHGSGPRPPEFDYLWYLALAVPIFVLMISPEDTDDIVDPLATMRLLPALASVFFPGALAIEPFVRRRPMLASELLFPLTREQLIDNLIAASVWTFSVMWAVLNAVAAYLLWSVPGLEPSILRTATFLFLSAAINLVMFAFALDSELWASVDRVVAALLIFVALAALLLFWWFLRDNATDLPFLIAGTVALAAGVWGTKHARNSWLNVELGLDKTA